MRKYTYSFLTGILFGVATILFLKKAIESTSFGPFGNEKKFNKRLWEESNGGQERLEMTDDLQIYYLRKGITKDEVIKLLGKPDGSGHYEAVYIDTSRVISYDMGYVFLDPCTFDLEFSSDERLISYEKNCN
jgi:hypothetical protein